MTYASIGIIAALVLLITNQDVLFRQAGSRPVRARKEYRAFLFSILAFFVFDVLWGLLYRRHAGTALLFADTELYFVAMSLTVFFWTRYVVAYLGAENRLNKPMHAAGWIYLALGLAAAAVNLFTPILFSFDEGGVYHEHFARHVLLIVQMVMLLLTLVYITSVFNGADRGTKNRYRTIAIYGAAAVLLILAQLLNPLLPFYSVSFLLGSCLLHAFVVEDEKEEYLRVLEEALRREKAHQRELGSARQAARTDPLTHVKNKLAYQDAEAAMEESIRRGERPAFALAIFDLNGLKYVNDTRGHEAGDEYIRDGCRQICVHFKHSPVFRIGGDEFAALLTGADYESRAELAEQFNRATEEKLGGEGAVVAMGM